jgi:hypothetical protein
MNHTEEYKGYHMTVDTVKRGNGYAWSYQIDGGRLRECHDRPLRNEEIMLQEAIGQAKAQIDHMAKK